MTNVVITGGAGFLGSRLARDLLAAGSIDVAGAGARPLARVTLLDQAPAPPDLAADPRVAAAEGDLAGLVAPGQAGREALAGADVVFHLAAAVSGECEADFDLGIRANLHATEALLAACRAVGTSPLVVYSSSIAVFGGSPELPLPAVVEDGTLPNPQTSYGIQKFIGEQLVADYTRKGFLRGRSIRLMTVSVRPGRPNAAASGFMSGIIREPLAGQRAVCPVDPAAEVALAAPARAIEALRCAALVAGRGVGRPYRGDHARPHGDGRGHGRRAGAGGRARGDQPHRLGPGPGGGGNGVGLGRPFPLGPGGRPGPDPRPRLHLDHPPAPGRDPLRLAGPQGRWCGGQPTVAEQSTRDGAAGHR